MPEFNTPSAGPLPDYSMAKAFGVGNLAVALLTFCCGGYVVGFYTFASYIMPMIQHQANAERDAYRRHLEDMLDNVDNPTDRQAIEGQIEQVDRQPAQAQFDPLGNTSPMMRAIGIIDYGLAMALAILLGVAGIGLLRLREWGRRLSVQLAVVKLLHVVISLAASLSLSLKALEANRAAMPNLTPATQMAFFMVSTLGLLVVCSIYPVLTLLLLRQPRIKAAVR